MENYKIYNRVMRLAFGFVAFLLIAALVTENLDQLKYIALIMLPLGVFQLWVALHFTISLEKRSEKLRAGLYFYWFLNILYFLGLYIASRFDELHEDFYWVYLLAVPWPIAIYQYCLVQRSYRERKTGRNKTAVS